MSNTNLPSSTHETTADVYDMDGADVQEEQPGSDSVDDDDVLDDADGVIDDSDDYDDDDDAVDDDLAIEDDDDDLLNDEDL